MGGYKRSAAITGARSRFDTSQGQTSVVFGFFVCFNLKQNEVQGVRAESTQGS